jgi:hypothetical protein
VKCALRVVVASALCLASQICATGAEMREWTDRTGRKFEAGIIANDAQRVTFVLPGGGKAVVPIAQLSVVDAAFVGSWRGMHPEAPLVDAEKLAPWPAGATAASIEIRLISEDPKAGAYVYEGAHFIVQSDVKLPLGVVADLNAVFEATRSALMALPLGLHRGGEAGKYRAFLFSTPEGYGRAGGGSASGGYYDGRTDRMLILLPNLGIRSGADGRNFDYRKNLFVLKHEVVHQLLRHWRGLLPMWFNEGLAEVMAATPYAQGRYTFSALDSAMGAYVKKWRSPGDVQPLAITPPGDLMSLSLATWDARVGAQNAYELYNSAALFTYFLLRHEGAGDGRRVASFLDALRRGEPEPDAVARQIRAGRSDARMQAEFGVFLRKLRLPFEFAPEPGAR